MFFVKIENDAVVQCWDTQPPKGESGWKSAVEVRPELIPNRQQYTAHSFDITKDPVEILWGVVDISPEDRKGGMISQASSEYQRVANEELKKDVDGEGGDVAVVQAASATYKARVAEINAATTHDELDAL
jgi:hypothetical protein